MVIVIIIIIIITDVEKNGSKNTIRWITMIKQLWIYPVQQPNFLSIRFAKPIVVIIASPTTNLFIIDRKSP